ncbi:MAG: hypothetical protein HPY69_02840 [Armatimonadetes bacterium]|nr:hypothetical protein [Armatimonadota bacterium]
MGCERPALIVVASLSMAGLSAGRPCRAEETLPGATQPLREITGDVHIRDRVEWRDAAYRVVGSVILHKGGTLVIENAQVELAGEYSRHYNWRWEGGKLVTHDATIGGSLRDGRVRQANIELTNGDWEATDTAVRYCYGITFGSGPEVGRLRARRLIAGPYPDTIIMTGRGDVVIEDSEYSVSLTANANAGPVDAVLDLPNDTPLTQVYDASNVPGAEFRLELVNTRVPHWFLFASGITNTGPTVTLTLRRCPWLIASILGWNLKGSYRLPTPWPGEARNQSLTVGNVTFRTLGEPVNVFCWGVYLSGPETDVTISGQTLICELMVFDGKCQVIGDEGTYNAATTATTVDVGQPGSDAPVELLLRNVSIGRFAEGDPVKGQITAQGQARVSIQHARTADLILITRDQGTIALEDLQREGGIEIHPEGGPIALPPQAGG